MADPETPVGDGKREALFPSQGLNLDGTVEEGAVQAYSEIVCIVQVYCLHANFAHSTLKV